MSRASILAMLWLFTACHGHQPHVPHAPVEYYASFGGYQIPGSLVEQLTQDQAKQRGFAYLVARYDGDRLVEVEKRAPDGVVAWRHEYTYDASGRLMEARITDDRGGTRVLVRGDDGKLHEPATP